jgi:hypothetical protein
MNTQGWGNRLHRDLASLSSALAVPRATVFGTQRECALVARPSHAHLEAHRRRLSPEPRHRDADRGGGFRFERFYTGYMRGPKPMTFMYEGNLSLPNA